MDSRRTISSCAKVPARYRSKCALTHLDKSDGWRLRHAFFMKDACKFTLNSNLRSIWIKSPQNSTGVSQTNRESSCAVSQSQIHPNYCLSRCVRADTKSLLLLLFTHIHTNAGLELMGKPWHFTSAVCVCQNWHQRLSAREMTCFIQSKK